MKYMNGYDPDKPPTKAADWRPLLAIAGVTLFLFGISFFLVEWAVYHDIQIGVFMMAILGAFMLVPWYLEHSED